MENIKILSEDEWSMMVGLLVRCGENVRELAREFSQGDCGKDCYVKTPLDLFSESIDC